MWGRWPQNVRLSGKLEGVTLKGRNANPGEKSSICGKENMVIPLKAETDLIQVVGKKPLINVWLNQKKLCCLWDTGSMICAINSKILADYFPGSKIHSVDEFLGTGLILSAANKTELGIQGIV